MAKYSGIAAHVQRTTVGTGGKLYTPPTDPKNYTKKPINGWIVPSIVVLAGVGILALAIRKKKNVR